MRSSGWKANRLGHCRLRRPGGLGQVVGLGPINPSLGRRTGSNRGWKKCATMSSCFNPAPCTPLPPRFWLRYRSVLVRYASCFGDSDNDVLSRAIKSVADVRRGRDDPAMPVVAVPVHDFGEFVAHDPTLPLGFCQDVFQIGAGPILARSSMMRWRSSAQPQLHVQDCRPGSRRCRATHQSGLGDIDGLPTPGSVHDPSSASSAL